eukprot:1932450-Rhodomonas_salina.11
MTETCHYRTWYSEHVARRGNATQTRRLLLSKSTFNDMRFVTVGGTAERKLCSCSWRTVLAQYRWYKSGAIVLRVKGLGAYQVEGSEPFHAPVEYRTVHSALVFSTGHRVADSAQHCTRRRKGLGRQAGSYLVGKVLEIEAR